MPNTTPSNQIVLLNDLSHKAVLFKLRFAFSAILIIFNVEVKYVYSEYFMGEEFICVIQGYLTAS
jgi:hypothetical protein